MILCVPIPLLLYWSWGWFLWMEAFCPWCGTQGEPMHRLLFAVVVLILWAPAVIVAIESALLYRSMREEPYAYL